MTKHSQGWQLVSIPAGVIMLFWIGGEIASILGFHVLQVIYLVAGVLVVWWTQPDRGQTTRWTTTLTATKG